MFQGVFQLPLPTSALAEAVANCMPPVPVARPSGTLLTGNIMASAV